MRDMGKAITTACLGQLQGYLSILDGFEGEPHENPAIGIILCKDMSEELKKALSDIEELKKYWRGDLLPAR